MTRSPRLRFHFAAGLLVAFVAVGPFATAQEATKTFVTHSTPRPVAAIDFADGQGQARSLADFKGKVVVLNIWATWCVPCRREMPALDRLQAALGGPDFEVVPLSIDRGGLDTVSNFYAEIGVSHLAKYIDTSGQVVRTVGAVGVPTTLIIDRAGNEVGRVIGPAEWDVPEIVELLKSVMAKTSRPNERAVKNNPMQAAQNDAPGLFTRSVRWLKALIR